MKMTTTIGDVQTLQTLTSHTSDVTSIDFASDCVLVTGSGDKRVRVWQWRSGEGYVEAYFSPLQGHKYGVTSVKVSPQSTMLASASIDGTTLLWNLRTGTKIHTMVQVGGETVRVCRFSPDSTLLATAGDNGQVCLWDLIRRNLVRYFQKHEGAVQSVCFSPDTSWLVTTCTFGVMKLFATSDIIDSCFTDNQAITALASIDDAHDLGVVSCDFSTCQKIIANEPFTKVYQLVTCGNDHYVKLWEVTVIQSKCETSTVKISLSRIMEKHSSALTCVCFNANGLFIASSGLDKTAVIWETDTGKVMAITTGHNRYVACCAFSRDGNLLATGSNDKSIITKRDKLIRVWSIETEEGANAEIITKFQEKSYSPLDGHKYSINHVEFSPCGRMLASCSLDGTVIIWNTENGSQAKSSFVNSGSGIRVCRWSPDGTKIATAGDDERTTLWDVNNMEELCIFSGHADAINAIAFTHDSCYLITACNEGTWRLFQISDNTNCEALIICGEAHDLGVQGCDFCPTSNFITNGRSENTISNKHSYLLATGGNDSLVKLWEITIDKVNVISSGSSGSSSGDVRYKERRSFAGHGGNVTCVRFPPIQSEILGSVATDRTARIWNVYSGTCLYVLEEHESLVTGCAFSQDTSLFITGALDKTVLIWKIPQQLISQNILINNLKNNRKRVADWKIDDTLRWLDEIGLSILIKKANTISLTGRHLLSLSENELTNRLDIEQDEETAEAFKTQLYWLKREDNNSSEIPIDDSEISHEFLCPITHEIMKEPVQCSDGFTYEKAAINEWFLCGKYTSPMTNKPLRDTSFTPNIILRNAIYTFLHGNRPTDDN
ncbi:WD repeat, SAM and U-box domain-containing protein 1-like isoform X2 [Bombus affinis]|uniref:WD repeat, SAM and U-box domain-containing protein 1-like isoform X2 n=1 Tax=Bombus affinis TaxID=309941 RepID=UPI0021B84259|nr:WD repeat, SAM and U-box domain-containing protein 1-like isoform X2 [Bombus affinis]